MKTQTRWKPNEGEQCFFVDKYGHTDWFVWKNDEYDRNMYRIGNCYRTRKEAQAAAKRVKAAYKG